MVILGAGRECGSLGLHRGVFGLSFTSGFQSRGHCVFSLRSLQGRELIYLGPVASPRQLHSF